MSTHSTTKKRKSDASTSTSAKKARLVNARAAETIESILEDSNNYPVSEDADAVRELFVTLALYARSLEEEIASLKPKTKTAEQLRAAAEKLKTVAKSGIQKQMAWKPSCKTGTAKWTYDGVCADPDVFGALLGLSGPPTFKTKKMPKEEFENHIGYLQASVRYATLTITGPNVNIHWNADEGTFKFSGTYGK